MGGGKTPNVRLFVPRARLTPPHQPLSVDDRRYLLRVHRLRAGDAFEVFDGEGTSHLAVVDPGLDSATLGGPRTLPETGRVSLELWQGLPKAEKLELIIQKATELGVARLVPLVTQHAVRRLTTERLPKLIDRWSRIAAEGARQCGRNDVPEITPPRDFSDFLARAREGAAAALVYEGEADASLWRFLLSRLGDATAPTLVALAIGPEGGFSTEEVEAARAAGVPRLSLGVRVLRTETAAIVVCALVLAASGGFD